MEDAGERRSQRTATVRSRNRANRAVVAAAWRHENLYIDPSGHRWKYLATPNSGWEMLLHFGNSVLQDKILFGTDWPLMPLSLKEIAAEARALPLKPEVMEKWMGGNAARFLGLSS